MLSDVGVAPAEPADAGLYPALLGDLAQTPLFDAFAVLYLPAGTLPAPVICFYEQDIAVIVTYPAAATIWVGKAIDILPRILF